MTERLRVRLTPGPQQATLSKLLIIIIITDLYSAFRSEDTEALDAAQD